MNQENLIQSPSTVRPHVVLLGAGASLDAFPEGDEARHRLPLMDNLVDVVGLGPLIETAAVELDNEKNLEEIYSKLAGTSRYGDLVKEILITTQAKRNLSSRSGIGGVRSAT